MGIKEDVDIAHYNLPIHIEFRYDGVEVSDPKVRIELTNAAGVRVRSVGAVLTLTATQKTQLKNSLDARIATFESNTGWTQLGS